MSITKTKVESKVNTFTHSSLKVNKENQFKKKKKALDVKLTTEWTKKQRRSRRSIVCSGVLKEKCMNHQETQRKKSKDLLSDDEFANEFESDHVPLSSSSVTSRDSLSDSPGISVIACDADVEIIVR